MAHTIKNNDPPLPIDTTIALGSDREFNPIKIRLPAMDKFTPPVVEKE